MFTTFPYCLLLILFIKWSLQYTLTPPDTTTYYTYTPPQTPHTSHAPYYTHIHIHTHLATPHTPNMIKHPPTHPHSLHKSYNVTHLEVAVMFNEYEVNYYERITKEFIFLWNVYTMCQLCTINMIKMIIYFLSSYYIMRQSPKLWLMAIQLTGCYLFYMIMFKLWKIIWLLLISKIMRWKYGKGDTVFWLKFDPFTFPQCNAMQ